MSIANNPSLSPLPYGGLEFGQSAPVDEVVELAPEQASEVALTVAEDLAGEQQAVAAKTPSAFRLGAAAVKGAIFGPFRQVKDIGGEVKQAARDYRSIRELLSDKATRTGNKLEFLALRAWYAAPLPAYQVADDFVTYPLYLQTQEHFNTGTAYGVTAAATFALAGAMGLGQRAAETKKATLVDVPVVDDETDQIPLILDASVNSAPWQVVRRANAPREEGEPIALTRRARIAQFAASYAVVNTALYASAEKLPGNEWLGFCAMLLGAWAVGGAYREVKAELNDPDIKTEEEIYG